MEQRKKIGERISSHFWIVPLSLIVLLALALIGTYTLGWTWTGFQRSTLWNWLNLLLLPLTIALVVAWFSTPHDRHVWWTILIGMVAGALALLALCSYLFGWSWTGFSGNTLWDWLSMLLVPTVVAATPIWLQAREPDKFLSDIEAVPSQKTADSAPSASNGDPAQAEKSHLEAVENISGDEKTQPL
jgi:putative effector of murein hydrolase